MADITPDPKRPWTDCETCIDRLNCDWCPFVLDRKATPLGADHSWLLNRTVDGEGKLLRPGLLDAFTAPKDNACPYGVTFATAQEFRAEKMVEAVGGGVLTADEAEAAAVKMGIPLT